MTERSPHDSPSPRALVHGAGPTGALAALALARAGWRVRLVDPQTADQLAARSRAYALTHSSRRLLRSLGLWEPLVSDLAPFRQLELRDQALQRGLIFSLADLPVDDRDADAAVGWILQHGPLMATLIEALRAEPSVSLALGAAAGQAPAGAVDLRVAADGHHSPTRCAARLRSWGFTYRQGCLTAQVRLRGSAPDQAWELFRPEGPFAVLPLGGDSAQLVWSAPLTRLQRLEALDGPAFLDAVSAALPVSLQAEVLLDQPRAWPVGWAFAWPLARRRLVLLGEAAHRCHPVGGQGLNLCWRDVAVLAELAGRCRDGLLPIRALPARYARSRWLDTLVVLLFTDVLVRLFSNRAALLLPVRQLALTLLRRVGLLRRLSLALMTDGPCPVRRG